MMHGHEKSDSAIVAGKLTNKSGAIRCGVGGAKGRDQGECGPTQHAPDSALVKRVTGVGSHTANYCRQYPRWEPYALLRHREVIRLRPLVRAKADVTQTSRNRRE
jgi:hypothetical protein